MTIEKLPSGSYRLRKMIDGKTYKCTVDHYPDETERALLLAEMIKNKPYYSVKGTIRQCIEGYIQSKSNVLSPSTVRGYRGIIRQIDDDFLDIRMSDLTLPILQNEVNRYAQKHAPKSVANFSGFLVSVCHFVGLDINSPTLPTKTRSTAYIPSKNDIQQICEYIKGSKYEIPLLLSIYGLRRSEVCALTVEDLSGNVLTINKALVEDSDRKWVIKSTKTEDSARQIIISDYLANLIRQQGYIYNGSAGQIWEYLRTVQDKLGIPRFPLHKMRHFYASYLHDLGYSPKQIQDSGGWKTSKIMETVYQHALDVEQAKKNMANDIASLTE